MGSMFSKLTGLAQKALEKNLGGNQGASGQGASGQTGSGQTDWRALVRNAADAITGDGRDGQPQSQPQPASQPRYPSQADQARQAPRADAGAAPAHRPATRAGGAGDLDPADRAAIARYDYLLQTAAPHQIETVHREAFERLTPAQRAQVDERMRAELPPHEQPRSSGADDLARAATRAEMAKPGMLKGLLARVGGHGRSGSGGAGRGGRGAGMLGAAGGVGLAGAGLAAGGVLAAVAGGAVVSSVAGPLLEQAAGLGVDFEALGAGIDLESLASGFEGFDGLAGGVDELAAGAGDTVSGLGDQVSGLGDQVSEFGSGFSLPGLDDLFGR